jgi:hypothetical protein
MDVTREVAKIMKFSETKQYEVQFILSIKYQNLIL